MARRRSIEDLSVQDLRWLIVEKQRGERQSRLEYFRQTGRVAVVAPQPGQIALETLHHDESRPLAAAGAVREREDNHASRSWISRFLLVMEVGALVGLILILFSGFNLLKDLNKEVASVLEQPTLTPTPLVNAVVLPSGHTPPNAAGGVRFNEAEIPSHLRPIVQSLADIPLPTPGPQQAIRIQIPSISVDHPVVQGDGYEQLKKGVGQYIGSPNPGQDGNIVLSAHNDVFGEIFKDLDQLKKGDKVILFTSQQTYTYIVQNTQIVEPTRVEVMAPTREPVVTLISCYPYLVDNKRIVVSAILEGEY